MDKNYLEKRREYQIKLLVGCYARGELTAEKANGIAGALAEIAEIERERERRLERAN